MLNEQQQHTHWNGWYFEGEFLCSPNGDRFTPVCILACQFERQLQRVRDLLYEWPRSVQ